MVQELHEVDATVDDLRGDLPTDDRVYFAVAYRGKPSGWMSYSYELDRRGSAGGSFRGLDLSRCEDAEQITRIAAASSLIQVRSPSAGLPNAKVRRGEAPWFGLFVQVLETASHGYSVSRVDGIPREVMAQTALSERDLVPSA